MKFTQSIHRRDACVTKGLKILMQDMKACNMCCAILIGIHKPEPDYLHTIKKCYKIPGIALTKPSWNWNWAHYSRPGRVW